MSKYEFLERLRVALSPLSDEERDSAVSYYEEFINDCESWDEAKSKLGSPEDIANQILSENGINTQNPVFTIENKEEKNKNGISFSAILIAILTFPLWVGFAGAAFGLLVAVIAVIFAVLVSFGAVTVSGLVGGIILLPQSISLGLILIGAGLVIGGLFTLAILPLARMFVNSMKSTITKAINFVKGLLRK